MMFYPKTVCYNLSINKKETHFILRIHEQIEFRPELPVIIGNIDYQNFKELLM